MLKLLEFLSTLFLNKFPINQHYVDENQPMILPVIEILNLNAIQDRKNNAHKMDGEKWYKRIFLSFPIKVKIMQQFRLPNLRRNNAPFHFNHSKEADRP